MKRKNGQGGVLLIYKKSAYQIYVRERKNERIKELVQRGDRSVQDILSADRAHVETIDEARKAVREIGVRGVFRYRSDETLVGGFDLIVTIGGDGTLLDHMMMLYGAGMSDSNRHDNKGLPLVLIGGGSGQLRPGGRHVKTADKTPVTNLHLTILDKMGVPVDTLGHSTGRLPLDPLSNA